MHKFQLGPEGGMIFLEKIADDDMPNCYYDIWLLTSGNINHISKHLTWNHLKPRLTGFARIIGYQSKIGQVSRINFMEEGQYKNGDRQGYARHMSAHDGECELGFYSNDILNGKGCVYKLDLKSGRYMAREGRYLNEQLE